MKKLKRIWLQCFNTALTGVLALLGFSSCSESLCEYGQPHASYELKGKVVNAKDETVSGIQLIIGEVFSNSYSEWAHTTDTLYSDNKGEFLYQDPSAWPDSKLRVKYRSIDADGNAGIYKTDSIDVDMGELSGGKGWYEGSASQSITIILEEKAEEDAK